MPETLPILGQPVRYDGRLCGACTWCCRALEVRIPGQDWETQRPVGTSISLKPAGCVCPWLALPPQGMAAQSAAGCSLHHDPEFPASCADYICPYVLLEIGRSELVRLASGAAYPAHVYRPDAFAAVLSEPWVEAVGVMPLVPVVLPVSDAIRLIRYTRVVPGALPDRQPDGSSAGFRAVVRILASGANPLAGRAQWRRAVEGWRRD